MLLRLDSLARWRARPVLSPRRRRTGWAALVSGLLHASVLAAILITMDHHRDVLLKPADTPATVELVMSPPGNDNHDASATAPQAETPPAAPATTQETQPPPAPSEAAAEPVRPAPPGPPQQAATEQPTPQPEKHELTFDKDAVESDTNALVTGDLIVPASPDIKFHNRKPSYPMDAARRGEHGAVILLIHVAPDGLVSGVDVMQTSGFPLLDQAARDAVLTWHFLPSVKDGQPIETDMPMRIVFALD